MIINKALNIIFIGKIDRFNYDEPSSTYKIFWVDGESSRSGWCKGNISSDCKIKVGDKVKLIGRWRIDDKYPDFGLQFFFSSCSLLPSSDFNSVNNSLPRKSVSGCITRVKNREGSARNFLIKTGNGDIIDCYGRVIPGHEILGGDRITLKGTYSQNHKNQFNYSGYDRNVKIKGSKTTSCHNSTTSKELKSPQKTENKIIKSIIPQPKTDQLNKIQLFIKKIGQVEVKYEFHNPPKNTIARHVRTQLLNRVVHAKSENKDLYFLTAFFDRNALDVDVQHFRDTCPDFKHKLFQCWEEANLELKQATQNIKQTIAENNFKISSPTFDELYSILPGRLKLNQILICLKIFNEIYIKNENTNIVDMCGSLTQEKILRDRLLKLYGVSYKLANWSLTNVTGHWFVIDKHIENTINNHLSDTVGDINISSINADQIFIRWFGLFNEEDVSYSRMSQSLFKELFPDYLRGDYQFLPFIITQYLWFYGKYGGINKNVVDAEEV
jgi:hypothetical protein